MSRENLNPEIFEPRFDKPVLVLPYGGEKEPLAITHDNAEFITFPNHEDVTYLDYRYPDGCWQRILHNRFTPANHRRLRDFNIPVRAFDWPSESDINWYTKVKLNDMKKQVEIFEDLVDEDVVLTVEDLEFWSRSHSPKLLEDECPLHLSSAPTPLQLTAGEEVPKEYPGERPTCPVDLSNLLKLASLVIILGAMPKDKK